MISKAVSVGGVGFADKTKPTQIRRSFEENFGLHKSIMNPLRKQPSAYSLRNRGVVSRRWEEKLTNRKERNYRPNPDGLDSEALLGFNGRTTRPFEVRNSRLRDKSLISVHWKVGLMCLGEKKGDLWKN
ncbi:MAG: hypothetical protein CL833_08310 [Crocinitomicaceae bacterium]|nr:hypothetical protein [Crocinitomicaceae bacterium]|tara:strand:- start:483 stop:869 length:387 start_codon:yes stop_codon:yes gene_type:complete